MIDTSRCMTIDEAAEAYRNKPVFRFECGLTWKSIPLFIPAPTFEEFITRNRITLYEEVVR